MQFYKKRYFGELISDTFDFFRQYGANFFRNYLTINGPILLLLLIVFYFGYGELFQQAFDSNLEGQQFFFEQYFAENQGVFIGMSGIMIVLFFLLSVISFSFPILYMKRISKAPDKKISSPQMMDDLKGIWKKIIIFSFGMIFLFILFILLLFVLAFIGSVILFIFIFIAFFVLILLFPALMNIVNLAIYEYYHTENGFFGSLSFAFRTQVSERFFKYWGSTVISLLIIQVISSVFSIIPIAIAFGKVLLYPGEEDMESMTSIIMFVTYVLSFIVSFMLNNIVYVNTGLMYYDAKKEFHKDIQLFEIESIGRGE